MITYVLGDIFTSPATVLVNTVNTAGVMGKGIARDFKAYFPEMFVAYQAACEAGDLRVGTLQFFRTPHKSVLNFPTKRHWREKSRIEDIEQGLRVFVAKYADYSISSIAFPQLGCGNGELNWESQVRPLMERYLAPLPIDVYIHLYDAGRDFVEHRQPAEMKRWLQSEPETLPFSEFLDDVQGISARQTDAGERLLWFATRPVPHPADEDQTVLVFDDGDTRYDMTVFELRQIWQQLRSFGLVADEDLGTLPVRTRGALFTVLTRLDYIEPVVFLTIRMSDVNTDQYGANELASGVRLVPRSESAPSLQQLELAGFA